MYARFIAHALGAMARQGRHALTIHDADGPAANPVSPLDGAGLETTRKKLRSWLTSQLKTDGAPEGLAEDEVFRKQAQQFLETGSEERQAEAFPAVYGACLSAGVLPEAIVKTLTEEDTASQRVFDTHMIRLLRAPALIEKIPHAEFWGRAGLVLANAMANGLYVQPGTMGPGRPGHVLFSALAHASAGLFEDTQATEDEALVALTAAATCLDDLLRHAPREAAILALAPGAVGLVLHRALTTRPMGHGTLLAPALTDALLMLARSDRPASRLGEALGTVLGAVGTLNRDDLDPAAQLRIVRGLLALAARRPDLMGRPGASNDVAERCFAEAASALKTPPRPLDRLDDREDVILGVLEETLAILTDQADALAHQPEHIPRLLGHIAGGALNGLAQGLAAIAGAPEDRFRVLLGADQAREYLGLIMAELTAVPATLKEETALTAEITAVVSGLIMVLNEDTGPSLSRQDWQAITVALAEETTRNPGTLFTLSELPPSGASHADMDLGPLVIISMLKGARKVGTTVRSISERGVSFGTTLADAIVVALAQAGSMGAGIRETAPALTDFIARIDHVARDGDHPVGATEWLLVFKAYLVDVFEDGVVPDLDDAEEIERIVFGG